MIPGLLTIKTKTMKHFLKCLFVSSIFLYASSGCTEYEATIVTGEVIPPILKYINMPSQDETIPGGKVYIEGAGFSGEDIIKCRSLEGEADFTAELVSADNFGIIIGIPVNAGGEYEVSVLRAGLTTVLNKHLLVAFVFTVNNIAVPASALPGETITIEGDGFETGDKVKFTSAYYPSGVVFNADATLTADGITLTVPGDCYGINSLTVIRGKKTCPAGNIKVPVSPGTQTGGGIVFYTSDGGAHGLIVAPANAGNTQTFGPSIQVVPYASGTSESVYAGKENTRILVNGITAWRNAGNSTPSTTAELCDNYSVEVNGIMYDDWFLGSFGEMKELFTYRSSLSSPYAFVPAENYWTSSVFPGSSWAWAYYYVNFWESTNLVTGAAPCDVWVIAARPIRQF
jgi:hypothetical protein